MGIVGTSMFKAYKKKIFSLPSPLRDEDLRNRQFLLEKDEKRKLEIYYTPFDYINTNAKILIAGITPGMHQMRVAYQTVHSFYSRQVSDEEILHEVKKRSSFEGSMRRNLVAMLDELGLAEHLGIQSSMELFGKENHLVQTASILPHAVFFDGKNYNGSRPDPWKTDLLRSHIETYFANDHSILETPLIIPLGVNVARVFMELGKSGRMDTRHMVTGFPHPSGSNGHRHKQFAANKEKMRQEIGHFFK
ncbi:uracil-DNA glycosylase family protein [Bacillus sp. FJAT-27445]|uniref:uracil-DNA glycosylase family protein n=1 Tax=Bacillus sp. FJAT-27445 TaxID=1679166 RepID=UPI000743ECE7|nr:uracil-DNA glycosylase family protein [Bacillus sp. FJAT-27445]